MKVRLTSLSLPPTLPSSPSLSFCSLFSHPSLLSSQPQSQTICSGSIVTWIFLLSSFPFLSPLSPSLPSLLSPSPFLPFPLPPTFLFPSPPSPPLPSSFSSPPLPLPPSPLPSPSPPSPFPSFYPLPPPPP